MTYYLAIVGTLDNPIYESTLYSARHSHANTTNASVSSPSQSSFSIFGAPQVLPPPALGHSNAGYGNKASKHVMQLVAHAALDVVEDVQWTQGYMYLKNIDKFHEWTVSVWLTPGGMKLILLHELKNDDGHRVFLHEVWEAYVKHLLNPFHEINAPVRSLAFDARVKAAAKKSL